MNRTTPCLTAPVAGLRALLGAANTTTCGNWTSNGEGRAMIGHHDRAGFAGT